MKSELYTHILDTSYKDTLEHFSLSNEEVIFQQDGDTKHTSKLTKKWLADNEINYIQDWPANNAYDTKPKNMDELWDRFDAEWNKFTKEDMKKYYERHSLSIQDFSLRDECQPQSIQQDYALCDRAVEERRNTYDLLFGQHMLTGIVKKRNDDYQQESDQSFTESGFHYQFTEECIDTVKDTTVFRLPIQHKENVNYSTSRKDFKTYQKGKTSIESRLSLQLQVDSESFGQDNIHATSNIGGPATHTTYTKGAVIHIEKQETKLGVNMPLIEGKQTGTRMVVAMDASNMGWGVASHELETAGFWTKSEKETSINTRELQAIYFGLKLHAEKYRGSTIRVYTDNMTALKYTVKDGGTASALLQDLAVKIQDLCNSYQLDVQYQHIPGVKNVKADQLSRQTSTPLYEASVPQHVFRRINQTMGPLKIDAFAAHGNAFVPTMEVRTTSNPETKTGEDQEGSTHHAILADTTLVSNGKKHETEKSADMFQIEEMVDDRMELISKARTKKGLTLENADYLNKATRDSTQKTYNSVWRKWTSWCRKQDPKVDATQYNVMKVIEFLLENKELNNGYVFSHCYLCHHKHLSIEYSYMIDCD
ncbi:hypothetical protein G6F17_012059 [Rhizopus arrhizus]|nr:hypothetical protein G6F17_012059 [Rhizopus arrhizus]